MTPTQTQTPTPSPDLPASKREIGRAGKRSRPTDQDRERQIDRQLDNSFPASDPPAWTSAVARPEVVAQPDSADHVEVDDRVREFDVARRPSFALAVLLLAAMALVIALLVVSSF